MLKPQDQTSTKDFFKRFFQAVRIIAIASPIGLTACAGIHRKDETIHAILLKENALIEKLQAERERPEIARAISENESLRKAEAHLSLGLEELMRANETIQAKILKTTKKEVKDERN